MTRTNDGFVLFLVKLVLSVLVLGEGRKNKVRPVRERKKKKERKGKEGLDKNLKRILLADEVPLLASKDA